MACFSISKAILKGQLISWKEYYEGKAFDMGKMARWGKALAVTPGSLSLRPGTHS